MDKKVRSSNFELLRVLAIILIVLFHIQLHGPQTRINDGAFSDPVFIKQLFLLDAGNTFGMIGNALFIMISGYFLVSNLNIDLAKISKKLLLEVGFATVVLTIASTIIIGRSSDLSGRNLVGINIFNDEWWFTGYYILVIVIGKAFLNKFLSRLEAKEYLGFLLALFAIDQFHWSSYIFEGIANGIRTLMIGVFFYALGGYIKKYDPFGRVRLYVLFLVIAVTYLLRYISNYNITSMNIARYLTSEEQYGFMQTVPQFANHEIAVVIVTVCLFELFKRIHMPNSRIINYLGKSTLMIYFIHENDLFISFYKMDSWIGTLSEHVDQFVLKWFKWGLIGIGLGVLAYTVFELLGLLCSKCKFLVVKEK